MFPGSEDESFASFRGGLLTAVTTGTSAATSQASVEMSRRWVHKGQCIHIWSSGTAMATFSLDSSSQLIAGVEDGARRLVRHHVSIDQARRQGTGRVGDFLSAIAAPCCRTAAPVVFIHLPLTESHSRSAFCLLYHLYVACGHHRGRFRWSSVLNAIAGNQSPELGSLVSCRRIRRSRSDHVDRPEFNVVFGLRSPLSTAYLT